MSTYAAPDAAASSASAAAASEAASKNTDPEIVASEKTRGHSISDDTLAYTRDSKKENCVEKFLYDSWDLTCYFQIRFNPFASYWPLNALFVSLRDGKSMAKRVKAAHAGLPMSYDDYTALLNTNLLMSALFLAFVCAGGEQPPQYDVLCQILSPHFSFGFHLSSPPPRPLPGLAHTFLILLSYPPFGGRLPRERRVLLPTRLGEYTGLHRPGCWRFLWNVQRDWSPCQRDSPDK